MEMRAIGHIIQVLHLTLVSAMFYFCLTSLVALFVWLFLIIFGHIVNNMICPITAVANYFFRIAGQSEFSDLYKWFMDFAGEAVATPIMCVLIIVPVSAAVIHHCQWILFSR